MTLNKPNWKPAQNWPLFVLLIIAVLWLTHALAFFAHEYAHSFTAWLLGWKANPLALNYGHLTVGNILAQFDIDENVDYKPIFATSHDVQAGIIAAAGMVVGNFLITYPLSRLAYRAAKRKNNTGQAFFFYWLCAASVGNLIDYVPMRTFAPSGDMHTVAEGFHCSPWAIIIVLGIPFLIALIHFFLKFAPQALNFILPNSRPKRITVAILTSFLIFGFYGAAGLTASDNVSHAISNVSIDFLIPLMCIISIWITEIYRKKATNH